MLRVLDRIANWWIARRERKELEPLVKSTRGKIMDRLDLTGEHTLRVVVYEPIPPNNKWCLNPSHHGHCRKHDKAMLIGLECPDCKGEK